ncbi:nucleotidyltransferase domain-containing protein [Candidatus Woesearchaeota archaeon]|nr:nucleotidyltransferase domain-containing protein [Candidatus Woesearchaeota archaeon]
MLEIAKTGNVNFYTANRSSEKYLLEKKLYNIKSMYESGLIEYLRRELSNPSVVLFGSYGKGEDTEESDIDLYIETPSKKNVSLKNLKNCLKEEYRHSSMKV